MKNIFKKKSCILPGSNSSFVLKGKTDWSQNPVGDVYSPSPDLWPDTGDLTETHCHSFRFSLPCRASEIESELFTSDSVSLTLSHRPSSLSNVGPLILTTAAQGMHYTARSGIEIHPTVIIHFLEEDWNVERVKHFMCCLVQRLSFWIYDILLQFSLLLGL